MMLVGLDNDGGGEALGVSREFETVRECRFDLYA